jgi:hypothetical protein
MEAGRGEAHERVRQERAVRVARLPNTSLMMSLKLACHVFHPSVTVRTCSTCVCVCVCGIIALREKKRSRASSARERGEEGGSETSRPTVASVKPLPRTTLVPAHACPGLHTRVHAVLCIMSIDYSMLHRVV